MNSVALPASASAPTLSAEGDLIRQAARGETAAFAELFRRHGQMAWRLAQAVSPDREASVAAVGNGFARSLRGARRRQAETAGGFRPLLLSAVYRCAMEDARAYAAAGTPAAALPTPAVSKGGKSTRARSKRDDSVLVGSAFRSLPERWRAALWLSEVEAMTADRLAPVLGVSEAVASQLVTRGTRGFAGRFAQAHRPVPEHLGTALREVALAMPANLAEVVAVRWKAVASDPGLRFAPVTAWLTERAARPLQVAVGGLLGMGLIGIGLVGQGSTVNTGPVAATVPSSGTGPGVSSFLPASSPTALSPTSGGLSSSFTAAAAGASSAGASTIGGGGASGSSALGSGAGSGTPTVSTPGGTTSQPGGGTTTPPGGGKTTPPPGVIPTPPVIPGVPIPSTVLPSNPVANVTTSGGTATATVLPTSSGSTATVTVGCSTGIGITVGTTTIGCPAPTTTATTTPTTATTVPSTPPTTTLVGGVLSGLGTTLGKL
jgi:DNA-directed RNA polymerase specialized sigma24 family protein